MFWTKEEDQILIDNKNLTTKEKTILLGRSVSSILNRIYVLGLNRIQLQEWIEFDTRYELHIDHKRVGLKIIIIDKESIDLVKNLRWSLAIQKHNNIYAKHFERNKPALVMHQLILGTKYVDHINGDGLDNRKINLRPATMKQNAQNRKKPKDCKYKYKGVRKIGFGRWDVRVAQKLVGILDNEDEAARLYDKIALEIFGEFARLNFPEENNI